VQTEEVKAIKIF